MKSFINNFPRQALHAATLGFEHPRSKQWLQFSSEIPADMNEILVRCGLKILSS